MGSRFNWIFVVLAIAVVVGYFSMTHENKRKTEQAKRYEAESQAHADPDNDAPIGGSFVLKNHFGQRVTEKDFQGKFLLLTFGYTYCPDVCPTKLQEMSLTLDALGQNAQWVQLLFITIDPERDTANQLKGFVTQFNGNIIGLTGSPEQIADIAKKFKIYYKRAESTGGGQYLMDHSSQIFLLDGEGKFLEVFPDGTDPAKMAARIKEYLPSAP
ncbi:MAG: SCO family protein [Alphaproteobacteria bacterium]